MEEKGLNIDKALEYVNGKLEDLKDELDHYTYVDKDKAMQSYAKYDIENFENIKLILENYKGSDKQCGQQ